MKLQEVLGLFVNSALEAGLPEKVIFAVFGMIKPHLDGELAQQWTPERVAAQIAAWKKTRDELAAERDALLPNSADTDNQAENG